MAAAVRQASRVSLSAGEETQLRAWMLNGASGGLRTRAAIVLAAAEGRTNQQIARRLSIHPGTVGRWRKRFRDLGLEGIRRQAPRPGPGGWARPRRI
ncbi:ISMsm2, transposase, partial [mine drainage metagenome]